VVGLTPGADTPPAREIFAGVRGAPVALVLGHEGDGLTPAATQACTHRARIPMQSDVDSLNVAMAAGIALYEWRQSMESP
jgi:tRNA G18 (ribose-2'-O)-methylase SpoU